MGIVVASFLIGVMTLAIYYLIQHYRFRQIINSQLDGPIGYFIIGNALQLKRDPEAFFSQICGTCEMFTDPKRMCRVWLGPKPIILIYGAHEVEKVFLSSAMINKSDIYKFLHGWLGLGLLTAPGPLWRPRRKQLTPTFHYDILKDFMHVFNEQSEILCEKLKKQCDKNINIYMPITLCTLDIICETAMGRRLNAQTEPKSDYINAVYRIAEIVHRRQKRPWMWPYFTHYFFGEGKEEIRCVSTLKDFTYETIKLRQQEVKQLGGLQMLKNEGRLAFIDLLLEMVENGEMTEDDVRSEVDTFMMEGHDTTATGLNWLIFLIGNDQVVQSRIHRELDEIFVVHSDDYFRKITADDLARMVYLDCCVKETLRLFPSVPIFSREVSDDVNIAGVNLPRGTAVAIFPYMIHRDPKQWQDPLHFRPERFMPPQESTPKGDKRHSYAFIPFSAGSRNCIGQRFAYMEEKVVIANILRNFYIFSTLRRDQVRCKAELILRSSEGTQVVLKQRFGNHIDKALIA